MKRERVVADVGELPTVVFGARGLMWWGMWGFAAIESMTLLLSIATYFYLRRNFHSFPPEGYPNPDWLRATIGVAVFLATLVPAFQLKKAAATLDRARTTRWLFVMSASGIVLCLVRWSDFLALRVLWMSSAYGSVTWVLLGFHASLLVMEAAEILGLTLIFAKGPVLPRHFPDATDITNYWYFLVASWIPVYVVVFLAPWIH